MKYATLRGNAGDSVFNNQGQFKLRYSRRHEITALAGWYQALNAPMLRPPAMLFFPVWTALALASGVAAWEIWRAPDVGLRNHAALRLWGWQLALNAMFTVLMFGPHLLLAASVVGAALLVVLGFTVLRFARLNRLAAALMLPYFCWVMFQVYLDAGFWWLNH